MFYNDIKVSNLKKILENILMSQRYNGIYLLFIFMALFFQKVFVKVSTMPYSDSPQNFL